MALSIDEVSTLAREISRRRPELTALAELSRLRSPTEVEAKLPEARKELEQLWRERQRAERLEREAVEEARRGVARAQEQRASVDRLLRASAAMDSALSRPQTSTWLDEGRRSLWSGKLEAHLKGVEALELRQQQGACVVELPAGEAEQLRQDLTSGVQAWADFSFGGLEHELRMLADELWMPLEGPPAAQNPLAEGGALAGLRIARPWEQAPEGWWGRAVPPSISRTLAIPALWQELLRVARAQFFSLGAVIGLLGLSGGARTAVAAGLLVPVAIFIVQRDRRSQLERLEAEARRAIQSELTAWATARLDRFQAQLRHHIEREQRGPLRAAWVDWHRRTVLPLVAAAQEEVARAERSQEQAREAKRQAEGAWPAREIDRLRKM